MSISLKALISEMIYAALSAGRSLDGPRPIRGSDYRGDAAVVRPGASLSATEIEKAENEELNESEEQKRAACVLIVSADGMILSVSRKNDPTAWGMPGGKVDPGETPELAAIRELKEETGLDLTDPILVYVASEDNGYETSTFFGNVSGQINTVEGGVIRWVTVETLLAGPFGSYNARLFAQPIVKKLMARAQRPRR